MRSILTALGATVAALALALCTMPALAADDTTVSVLPLYKIVEPYLVMIVGIVVSAGVGWIGLLLKKRLGVDLDATMNRTIQEAAMNAAGSLVARMEGPIGNIRIDVRSQIVKDGVDLLYAKAPDAIAHFGLTAEELGKIIQGKIGVLQAGAGAAAAKS